MNIPSKRCLGMALIMAVTFSQAQITTADNGLNATGTAPTKNVSLGGTLNNATSIDFGTSNPSSNFLFKKGTSNYFFIGNDGNIGIGNSTPAQKLDVTGMVQSTTGFKFGSTIGATLEPYFEYSKLSTNTTTDGLIFWTSKSPSSIKFVINNAARGLMLDGNTSNLLFLNSDGNSLGGIGSANGTGHLAFLYSTAPGSHIEGARLTNTGNLGIGISNPLNKLHVYSTTGTDGISLDGTNNPAISFRNSGTIKGYIAQVTTGGNYFTTAATNDLIIRSEANNILLGRGSQASTLAIVGDLVGVGTATPDQTLTLNAPNGVNSLISLKQNGTTKAYVGLGTDGVFRNQTLSGTELQLRADGGSNFISLYTGTTEKLRITPSGNVGIGTTDPGPYKLAVEGTIGARKVKVTLANPWADFVFEKDYDLPTLLKVEQFIQTNKHLPGVPSAKEVEKNGLDVGETQAILLQKIEELTLYVIQLQKEIDVLKNKK